MESSKFFYFRGSNGLTPPTSNLGNFILKILLSCSLQTLRIHDSQIWLADLCFFSWKSGRKTSPSVPRFWLLIGQMFISDSWWPMSSEQKCWLFAGCGGLYFWSIYSDLKRPHTQWWFSKGNLLFQGNLAWWNIIIWPDTSQSCGDYNKPI